MIKFFRNDKCQWSCRWIEKETKLVPFTRFFPGGIFRQPHEIEVAESVTLQVCSRCGAKRAYLSDPKWDNCIDNRQFPNGTRQMDIHLFDEITP